MAKKKETKKKPETKIHATWLPARGVAAELKELLNEAAPKIVADIAHEQGKMLDAEGSGIQTTDGLGNTQTFVVPNSGEYVLHGGNLTPADKFKWKIAPLGETRQNRLDLYDGTAELLLKLKNNLDLLTWTNLGIITEGVGRGIRIEVESDYAVFYTKPFFSSPEKIGGVVIGRDLEEKILLRAGTSVPNRKVLKLLNEL